MSEVILAISSADEADVEKIDVPVIMQNPEFHAGEKAFRDKMRKLNQRLEGNFVTKKIRSTINQFSKDAKITNRERKLGKPIKFNPEKIVAQKSEDGEDQNLYKILFEKDGKLYGIFYSSMVDFDIDLETTTVHGRDKTFDEGNFWINIKDGSYDL